MHIIRFGEEHSCDVKNGILYVIRLVQHQVDMFDNRDIINPGKLGEANLD